MNRLTLMCETYTPLQVRGNDGLYITLPKGKTLTLMDAYTQEDDTDIAIISYEEQGVCFLAEVSLSKIMPHIACREIA